MSIRTIEQRIEIVRKRMEETATLLGLGHPKVYLLSKELDQLHILWVKEHGKKRENIYHIHSKSMHVNESPAVYKVVV